MSKPPMESPGNQKPRHRHPPVSSKQRSVLVKSAAAKSRLRRSHAAGCLTQCVVRALRDNNQALARERCRHLAEIGQLGQQLRDLQAENMRLQQQVAAMRGTAATTAEAAGQLGGKLFELHSHNVRALDSLYKSVSASQKLMSAVQSEYERPLDASITAIGEQLSVLLTAYTDPFSRQDLLPRSPLRPVNLVPEFDRPTVTSSTAAAASTVVATAAAGVSADSKLRVIAEEPQQQQRQLLLPRPGEASKTTARKKGRGGGGSAKAASKTAAATNAKRRPVEKAPAVIAGLADPFSSRPRLPRTPPPTPPVGAAAATAPAKLQPAAAVTVAKRRGLRGRILREVVVDVKVERIDENAAPRAARPGKDEDVFEPRSAAEPRGVPSTLQGFRNGKRKLEPPPPPSPPQPQQQQQLLEEPRRAKRPQRRAKAANC